MLKELFVNERVRVFDFVLSPNESIKIEHNFPSVRWNINECEVSLGVDNESNKQAHFSNKQTFWIEKGCNWTLQNTGDNDVRQIIFEILQPPKYTNDQCDAMLAKSKFSTAVGTEKLFENDWVRLWDFYFAPGAGDKTDVHQHTIDYVFVIIGNFEQRLLGYDENGKQIFDSVTTDGDVEFTQVTNGGFNEDNTTVQNIARHAPINGSSVNPYVEYLVELK